MRVNIVNAAVSRNMLAQLPNHGMPVRHTWRMGRYVSPAIEIILMARCCMIKGKASGGVVIEAQMPRVGPFRSFTIKRRLSPGWSEKRFKNAIIRTMNDVEDWLRAKGEIVALYNRVGTLSQEVKDKIEKEAPPHIETLYNDMTKQDVAYWKDVLDKLTSDMVA